MPITFNEETNLFEGANAFGETLAGFDFSVFGGMISNSGAITASVTANTIENIEFSNTLSGTLSSSALNALDLSGDGDRLIINDGYIDGSVKLGTGFDTFLNTGTIEGQISTGKGKDILTNQIIPGAGGGPFTDGTIIGDVNMGRHDDTVLNTGVMADVLLGSGNDTYTVGGFDSDDGTGSADIVRGGSGDDTMTGGASDDHFFGGGDDDRLLGNGGRDFLEGRNGADFLDGGIGNDRLFGGDGDDMIFGDRGHDRLVGGDGDDILEGGQGRDVLFGGAGADVFVFGGNTNKDRIRDFDANDRIDLHVDFSDGVITYDDIMANTEFTGGDAIIDLSAIFNLASGEGPTDKGSVLTVKNVTADDLGESAFGFIDDAFALG